MQKSAEKLVSPPWISTNRFQALSSGPTPPPPDPPDEDPIEKPFIINPSIADHAAKCGRSGRCRWRCKPSHPIAPVATDVAAGANSLVHVSSIVDETLPLIKVVGEIDSCPAIFLVDCGATNNFIDPGFIARHGLSTISSDRTVRVADGHEFPAVAAVPRTDCSVQCEEAEKVGWPIDPFNFRSSFESTDLYGYDAILGLPWFRMNDPRFRWADPTAIFVPIGEKVVALKIASSAEVLKAEREAVAFRASSAIAHVESRGVAEGKLLTIGAVELETPRSANLADSSSVDSEAAAALLEIYADVFPDKLPSKLPPSRGVEHYIELIPGATPTFRRAYRLSASETKELKNQLDELEKQGFIQRSKSPYGAPVMFVKKKDGTLRLVVDYRALNNVTVKNRYPLPLTDELFDLVHGARYFSKIDLRTGFYQIRIADKDVEKTAFLTRYGSYEFKVLPMGLCNAPATFMHLMNATFKDYLDDFIIVFLDDILIFSKTLAEHKKHVALALDRLRESKLYAKASKCEFFKREVSFLGHQIGADGLRTMDEKVKSVMDWPRLTSVGDVRSFLGMVGYYRKFIKDFSRIALPLSELTKNRSPFRWTDKTEAAFNNLKNAIRHAPVLLLPDPKLPFVIHTDASGFATGAVLQQDQGNGLQPIAFMSKKLLDAETRYPVHEQELLAIVQACQQWRHYLVGAQFRVLTDHRSLQFFQTQPMLSGRQARWREVLANYDFIIEYVAGTDNSVADGLSRRPDHQTKASMSHLNLISSHIFTHEGTTSSSIGHSSPTSSAPSASLSSLTSPSSPSLSYAFVVATASARARRPRRPRPELPVETQAAERARNIASATENLPPALDLPGPNAAGVIVMPSQQCTATTKAGKPCKQRTAKGQYCWNHLRTMEGLRVKLSHVPNAGLGLFAEREFKANEKVAIYAGDKLIDGPGGGVYQLGLTKHVAIDAARTNCAPGRYANDPRGTNSNANTKFCFNHRTQTASLRSTRRIRKGDEVLIKYGRAYWDYFGKLARKAAAGAVVAVNTVTSSAISLEDEVKRSCLASPTYQAELQLVRSSSDPLQRNGDVLTFESNRIHLPTDLELLTRILAECHDAGGHLGRDKTMELIKRRFHWVGMDKMIEQYVVSCDACQRNKPSQQAPMGLLMPLPIPDKPWEQVSMDLIGPLPRSHSGNDAIVVFVDKLTKVVHYVATTMQVTAPGLASLFLREVVRLHGVPKSILSDRDPRFTANFWSAFWSRLGTKLAMSTAYHPQSDGQTERANRTLESVLRSCVDFEQRNWDEMLPIVELAINNAQQTSTGQSPFFLLYGRNVDLPIDQAIAPLRGPQPGNPTADQKVDLVNQLLKKAKQQLEIAQRRQARSADDHRRDVRFKVGDSVLLSIDNINLVGAKQLKRTAKLSELFLGPFTIKAVVNANAYTLNLPPTLRIHPTVNITRIKEYKNGHLLFPSRPQLHPRPPPVATSDNGAPEWEAEQIVGRRGKGQRLQYLVKWVGYPMSEATWEWEVNVENSPELIADYEDRREAWNQPQ